MHDDETPRPQPMGPKNLETMSIAELEAYIKELKDEIIRVEEDMEQKKSHQDAVSSLFKS